jgi:dsRNA-specific ribonuclease
MSVKIEENIFGTGKGKNKQEAEERAAEDSLSSWEDLITRFPPKK